MPQRLQHDHPAPVTVVIPAHNAVPTLAESLRSIEAQTLPPAEVLVIDDGSTDGTAELAESFGARVLRQPNRGVSAARNRGIRKARQPFIAFLDADDVWMPDKIARQMRAFELCPEASFCFTDLVQFEGTQLVTRSFLSQRKNYLLCHRFELEPGIVRCDETALGAQFVKGNFISPSTLMVRRTTLFQIGLFDETLTHCEDRELCLRLLAAAIGTVVEDPQVRYRIHAGGASRNRGKMSIGSAMVAARVLAAPRRYPEGALEHYRTRRPIDCYWAGVLALEMGDVRLGRQLLWSSLRRRPALRSLSVWLLSLFGAQLYAAARATHRRVSQAPADNGEDGA